MGQPRMTDAVERTWQERWNWEGGEAQGGKKVIFVSMSKLWPKNCGAMMNNPQHISKRICTEICRQTKKFYVHVFRSRQFSASATYLAPSKRILKFFLGFQIPPIFCISQLA